MKTAQVELLLKVLGRAYERALELDYCGGKDEERACRKVVEEVELALAILRRK